MRSEKTGEPLKSCLKQESSYNASFTPVAPSRPVFKKKTLAQVHVPRREDLFPTVSVQSLELLYVMLSKIYQRVAISDKRDIPFEFTDAILVILRKLMNYQTVLSELSKDKHEAYGNSALNKLKEWLSILSDKTPPAAYKVLPPSTDAVAVYTQRQLFFKEALNDCKNFCEAQSSQKIVVS